MQKLKYIYLFITLISLALFITCRKYPEGGWSNVAIKHLFGVNETDRVWKLKLYEVNGIDSTSFIIPNNGVTSFENNELRFQNLTTGKELNLFVHTKIFEYKLEFTNRKKTSFIIYINRGSDTTQCENSVCERNIFNPEKTKFTVFEWKILKLKKNEFIITSTKINSYKIILTH